MQVSSTRRHSPAQSPSPLCEPRQRHRSRAFAVNYATGSGPTACGLNAIVDSAASGLVMSFQAGLAVATTSPAHANSIGDSRRARSPPPAVDAIVGARRVISTRRVIRMPHNSPTRSSAAGAIGASCADDRIRIGRFKRPRAEQCGDAERHEKERFHLRFLATGLSRRL
jgi:hypothetical protein